MVALGKCKRGKWNQQKKSFFYQDVVSRSVTKHCMGNRFTRLFKFGDPYILGATLISVGPRLETIEVVVSYSISWSYIPKHRLG
jgi:hypothetical protein